MIIIKYTTEEEGQQIIADKTSQGYTLIEVQNITEGNFLGFLEPNETLPEKDKTELQVLQETVDTLVADNLNLQAQIDTLITSNLQEV
ncbi:hypothetical protein [Clostridium sp. BNL1100]|uniref:hypothetical protein n=1 Tax=Clostridium sp. BNL1100 TaxID=755731 RepID=UPI00024A78D3|nr:hypothetical protein [Clostridium sp. BNL1100]AEY64838.1 hypothetical protein Clo1100_0559 [Clostridium sp. BNL1100]